jgi:arginyl-tRNA synthetase
MDPDGKRRGAEAGSARDRVTAALCSALSAAGLDPEAHEIHLERPNDPSHGDLSCNIALVSAKTAGRRPRELAQQIADSVSFDGSFMDRVEIAGPGFINFTFSREFLREQVVEINRQKGDFGDSDMGKGKKIQVEFVSANPTGPLVIVSARAAAVGSALVNILRKTGYEVEAEYYVNDAGAQVGKLGLSIMARFRQLRGEDVDFPEDGYPGEYLIDIAKDIDPGDADDWLALSYEERVSAFGSFAIERITDSIREDLDKFGAHFDLFFKESDLHGEGRDIARTLGELSERGVVYEDEGALWFRSTEFGDEKDRVLVRSDESPTYFLADAAYHRNKLERGFHKVIDIWGPDHHGHIKRLQAASSVLGAPPGWLEVLIVQWVRLVEEGKQVSMSKRGGEFVSLRDLVDDVGVDAAKYFFLMRKTNAHLDFNLTLARKASDENPVYYVQYAHARISSVISFARDEGVDFPEETGCVDLLDEPEEIDLMRILVVFPQLVDGAARSREPHRLTSYAQQLAASFHHFYHICRIVSSDVRRSEARLMLAGATRIVLAECLRILGVSAPEKM